MRASDERARRRRGEAGFTLVELTVVVVISTIALIAIYQTLITQERTYRYQTAAIDAQGTSRMALAVIAAELREISAGAGETPNMGGTDLLVATQDSLRVRAFRKVGIVCSVDPGTGAVNVWVRGQPFVAGSDPDRILFYQAGNTNTADDDAWDTATLTGVAAATDPSCSARWASDTIQTLAGIAPTAAATIQPGSMIRSFVPVSYGNYRYRDINVLGRVVADTLQPLVGPILPNDSSGLEFQYFDGNNNRLTTLTSDAGRSAVSRIQITLRSVSRGGDPQGGDWIDSVSTSVYLRGN